MPSKSKECPYCGSLHGPDWVWKNKEQIKPEDKLDPLYFDSKPMKPQTQTAKHTQGDLKVCDGALLCPDINNYGNFIIVECNRERNCEDNANLERLALCWNQHDQLIAQRDVLLEAAKRLLARLRNETSQIETCDMAPSTEQAIEQGEDAIALCEPVKEASV